MLSWTDRRPSHGNGQKPGLLRRKLELLESDAEARRLLFEIQGTLPKQGSKDYHDMALGSHYDPDFDWKPFREKMNELITRVRESRPG